MVWATYSNATYKLVTPAVFIPAVALANPSNNMVLVPGVNLHVCPVVEATPILLTKYVVPPPALSTNLLKFVNVPVNDDGYTIVNDVVLAMLNVQPFVA